MKVILTYLTSTCFVIGDSSIIHACTLFIISTASPVGTTFSVRGAVLLCTSNCSSVWFTFTAGTATAANHLLYVLLPLQELLWYFCLLLYNYIRVLLSSPASKLFTAFVIPMWNSRSLSLEAVDWFYMLMTYDRSDSSPIPTQLLILVAMFRSNLDLYQAITTQDTSAASRVRH